MTTLISWMSRAGTGKRTVYLGADSLGTSISGAHQNRNFIRKVYASKKTPEIFGFCGDVAWGQYLLEQLVVHIQNELVSSPLGHIDRAYEFTQKAFASPPRNRKAPLEILYCARQGVGRNAEMFLFKLAHNGVLGETWDIAPLGASELASEKSTLIYSTGAGARGYRPLRNKLKREDQGEVSRVSFWALCDLIDGTPNPKLMTGGVPQLVKIDETGDGSLVGVKYFGRYYVNGRLASNPSSVTAYWVDETFTGVNPATMKPWSKGQRYGRRIEK